jgi:hypothetical protein
MLPIGWLNGADGKWRPYYEWKRTATGWAPVDAELKKQADGSWLGVHPPAYTLTALTMRPLYRDTVMGQNEPPYETVDYAGRTLPMHLVEGKIVLRVKTGTVSPGATLRVAGGNSCEFGNHWQHLNVALTSNAAIHVHVARGEFTPDPPIVRTDSANVSVIAFHQVGV